MSDSRDIPTDTGVDFDSMSEEETMTFVDAFLNRLSFAGLRALIDKAQREMQLKQEEERAALVAEFQSRAAGLGLRIRLEPLEAKGAASAGRGRSDQRRSVLAKYRGPNGETWSGRGRSPRWLVVLEASGHNREGFRIQESGS